MTFGVCIVSISPIRKAPSHTSEMVSQLLFGEFVEIIETEKTFSKVKCLYDGYEGWVQNSQLDKVSKKMAQTAPLGYIYKPGSKAIFKDDKLFLPIAAPVYKKIETAHFNLLYDEPMIWNLGSLSRDYYVIKSLAILYINTPYLWGGRSNCGIDCSGFTQQVFKMLNIPLKRDAYQQAEQGNEVVNIAESVCGDLAFFDNEEGRITHVGIILNNDEIIHSSGRVRIDKLDDKGIINVDTNERTHNLKVIKRMI